MRCVSFPTAVLLLGLCGLINDAALAATASPMLEGLVDYSLPRFPAELRGNALGDGEVVMAFTIDAAGRVDDHVVLEATHAAFANAVIVAVESWRFNAVDSDTFPRRVVVQFGFKRSGVVTTLTHAEAAREGFIHSDANRLQSKGMKELDTEPKRLHAPMPQVSQALLAKRGHQPLLVNFIIDRDGRVRVPVLSAKEDAALAMLVLHAVKQWRYEPPLFNGDAVAVEVTRSLTLPVSSRQ